MFDDDSDETAVAVVPRSFQLSSVDLDLGMPRGASDHVAIGVDAKVPPP